MTYEGLGEMFEDGEIWSFFALVLAIVVGNDDVGLPLYVDILFGNHSYNL